MTREQKTFADNAILQTLAGPLDENFKEITRKTGVLIQHRGNTLTLTHDNPATVQQALHILDFLYERAKTMTDINTNDIDNALNAKENYQASDLTLRTKKKHINPRTETQRRESHTCRSCSRKNRHNHRHTQTHWQRSEIQRPWIARHR